MGDKMMFVTRRRASILIASIAAMVFAVSASAQSFPSRAVTIVIPFAPGGGVDLTVRRFSDIVSKNIGKPVIVENRAGGGGVVAATATLNAPADGYTVYLNSPATHGVGQVLQDLPFDPLVDFKPVTKLFSYQNVLVVPQKTPVETLEQFIEYAKKKPDGLVYGSPGHGSPAHILGAMLADRLDIKGIQTPFRNGPEMNLAMVRGDLDYGFGTYQGMQEFWRAGQVKILATVGDQRAKVFPDYPTMKEAGLSDIDLVSWYGLVVPAATPDNVIEILAAEFKKASEDKSLREWLDQVAFDAVPESEQGPEAFAALMKRETDRYAVLIPALGIKRSQ
jgi:tripartite-type tricarboxylate transporter receptor subunit TctC